MNVVQRIILIAAAALNADVALAQEHGLNEEKTYRLGVVAYEGFELLDIMGPLEMFGSVGKRLEIVMIAEKVGEVSSAQKVKTVAEYSFENCPKLDLLLFDFRTASGRWTLASFRLRASVSSSSRSFFILLAAAPPCLVQS